MMSAAPQLPLSTGRLKMHRDLHLCNWGLQERVLCIIS